MNGNTVTIASLVDMARGEDTRNHDARIVDMAAWKRRNHPTTRTGGGGKKPPKYPKTGYGGYSKDSDPTPWNGTPRPNTDWYRD